MAARRYQIWDKQSHVYTPVGEDLTPEQWIARFGWINAPGVVPIVAAGAINGGFSGTLDQLKSNAERMGAVFDESLTDEELLEVIEDFEDEMNKRDLTPSAEERTAAALEFLALSSVPDEV